jgi:integrase
MFIYGDGETASIILGLPSMEGDVGNRPVPGRGEMVNLRWDEVDLESKLIHIQSDATFRTKAGKRRSFPLNNDAMEILQRRNNLQECEYVFTHRRRQLDGDWVSKRFVMHPKSQDRL